MVGQREKLVYLRDFDNFQMLVSLDGATYSHQVHVKRAKQFDQTSGNRAEAKHQDSLFIE